jgi:hypothetical protein
LPFLSPSSLPLFFFLFCFVILLENKFLWLFKCVRAAGASSQGQQQQQQQLRFIENGHPNFVTSRVMMVVHHCRRIQMARASLSIVDRQQRH